MNQDSYDSFHSTLTAAALSSTRCSAVLPPERDLAYHKSLDAQLAHDIDQTSERLLRLTSRLVSVGSEKQTGKGKGKEKLKDEDLTDGFEKGWIVDVMDLLLEGTDTSLDVVLGKIKEPAIYVNPNAPPVHKPRRTMSKATTNSSDLPKPQLKFKPSSRRKIHNNLPPTLPYPDWIFQASSPCQPKSFQETPFTLVSTLPQYQDMLRKLSTQREIAVDLEHHDYRTYTGILCLMQISSRDQDFVVDILDPDVRAEVSDGEDLRRIFEDPAIVKVFHGAEHDVVWLQRDFNIQIVNLFDTFHASKILEFPSHSLSSLLQLYCSVTPDKSHQLADWRIRPLPENMLHYARSDTHYLLYIYDELRNALLDRGRGSSPTGSNSTSREASPSSSPPVVCSSTRRDKPTRFLRDALTRSHITASKDVPVKIDDSGALLAKKWNKPLLALSSPNEDSQISLTPVVRMQRDVYVSVFKWRDAIAREEDENVRYIMQNHHLFQLAERPPSTLSDLLRLFGGTGPSPSVKKRAEELLGVIKEAVVRGLEGPSSTIESVAATKEAPVHPIVRNMKLADNPRLWETITPSVVSSSTLFGAKNNQPSTLGASESITSTKVNSMEAKSSSLFGTISRLKLTTIQNENVAMDVDQETSSFQQIVAKIHSSLTLLPSAISSPAESNPTSPSPPEVEEEKDTGVPGMHVEIPFVPLEKRATNSAQDESTLMGVSVGRSGKRKRKAPKKGVVEEQATPFDFDQEPNLLDVKEKSKTIGESSEGVVKKRQKRGANDSSEKGKHVEKEKRNRISKGAEVRIGNSSRTFR